MKLQVARLATCLGVGAALAVAPAAQANQPATGSCPQSFTLWPYAVPYVNPDGSVHYFQRALAAKTDVNGDGYICIKPEPDGMVDAHPGAEFSIIDNLSQKP